MVACILLKVSAQFEKKNGRRIPEILGYVKERKGGDPKTASERGRYLMVPFISMELDQDLMFLHAIFSKMDNGSILHIFFAFTANFIVLNRTF